MGTTLEGKRALITGAGRGIGLRMTQALLEEGASVAMLEVDADALEEGMKAAGSSERTLPIVADVTSEDDAASAVAACGARFGGLDILINNAAMGPQFWRTSNVGDPPKVWEVPTDMWKRVQLVNATGPYVMICAALPGMLAQGWGRIVNVTTSLDTMYRAGSGPYGPAKAALEALTTMLSQELADTGVTANVLVPGGRANTRMIPRDGQFVDRSLLIQPDVMAAPIKYLVSDAADSVNGMRFQGVLWDPELPPEEAMKAAGQTVGWQQLGRKIRL